MKKKTTYTLRRKTIPNVILVSLTGTTWYDSFGNVTNWDDIFNYDLTSGTTIYNFSGETIDSGYYIFNGSRWVNIDNSSSVNLTNLNDRYQIDVNDNNVTGTTIFNNSKTYETGYYEWDENSLIWYYLGKKYDDHQIPITLLSKVDEYGQMTDFSGDIYQEISDGKAGDGGSGGGGGNGGRNGGGTFNASVNFVYTGVCESDGYRITVFNTTDTSKLRLLNSLSFVINWSDESTSNIAINGNVTKKYVDSGKYPITVTMTAPWKTESITKTVNLDCTADSGTLCTFVATFTNYVEPVSTSTVTPTITPTVTPTIGLSPTPTLTITPTKTKTPTPTKTPTQTKPAGDFILDAQYGFYFSSMTGTNLPSFTFPVTGLNTTKYFTGTIPSQTINLNIQGTLPDGIDGAKADLLINSVTVSTAILYNGSNNVNLVLTSPVTAPNDITIRINSY